MSAFLRKESCAQADFVAVLKRAHAEGAAGTESKWRCSMCHQLCALAGAVFVRYRGSNNTYKSTRSMCMYERHKAFIVLF